MIKEVSAEYKWDVLLMVVYLLFRTQDFKEM